MLLSRLFKGMKLKMFSVSSSCRAISCFSPLILVVAWCVNALASDSFDTRFEVDGVVTYFPSAPVEHQKLADGARLFVCSRKNTNAAFEGCFDEYGILVGPPKQSYAKAATEGFVGLRFDDSPSKDANVSGVRIVGVSAASPAEKARLKTADIVVEVDGDKLRSADEFLLKVRKKKPGDVLELKYRREEIEHTAEICVGERLLGELRTRFEGWGAPYRGDDADSDKPKMTTVESSPVQCNGYIGFQWYAENSVSDGPLNRYIGVAIREVVVGDRLVRVMVSRTRVSRTSKFDQSRERLNTQHSAILFFQQLHFTNTQPENITIHANDGSWVVVDHSDSKQVRRGTVIHADPEGRTIQGNDEQSRGQLQFEFTESGKRGQYAAKLSHDAEGISQQSRLVLSRLGNVVATDERSNGVREKLQSVKSFGKSDQRVAKWSKDVTFSREMLEGTLEQVAGWQQKLARRGGGIAGRFGVGAGEFTARDQAEAWRRRSETSSHRERSARSLALWESLSDQEREEIGRLQPDFLWELMIAKEMLE